MGIIPSSPTIPRCPLLRDGDFLFTLSQLFFGSPYLWRILGRLFWLRRYLRILGIGRLATVVLPAIQLFKQPSTLTTLSSGRETKAGRALVDRGHRPKERFSPTGILSTLVLVLWGTLFRTSLVDHQVGDDLPKLAASEVPFDLQVGGVESPGRGLVIIRLVTVNCRVPGFSLPVWHRFTDKPVDPKPSTGRPVTEPAHKGHRPKNRPSSGIPLVVAGGFSAAWFLAMPLIQVTTCTFLGFPLSVKFKGSRGPTVWVAVLTFLKVLRPLCPTTLMDSKSSSNFNPCGIWDTSISRAKRRARGCALFRVPLGTQSS